MEERMVAAFISGLIIALYLFFCKQVGKMGEDRTLGDNASFFLSLFFTPIVGVIIVSLCDKKFIDADGPEAMGE